MESMAQGVAQRVVEASYVDTLDVNALLARIDLNALLAKVDLNPVLDRVDLNQVLDRVDLNQVLDRVDLNEVMSHVDINQIAGRIDIEALVKNTDIGALLVSSSATIGTGVLDRGRSHGVSMDDTLARWASRLRPNRTQRSARRRQLMNAQELP